MTASAQTEAKERQKLVAHLYGLADAMGATLYQSSNYKDEWLGCSPRTATIGPWLLSISNAVWSDEVSDTGASLFVKMKGDLWGYAISQNGKLRMVLFNGKDFKITRASAPTRGTRVIDATLEELESYIVAYFNYTSKGGWKQVEGKEF